MKEYIEREAAIKAIENDSLELIFYSKREAIDCIKAEPAADVVERKRGEWVVAKRGNVTSIFSCSECGREVEITNPYFGKPTTHAAASYPFCHCGADMRSHQNILCDQTEEVEHDQN